MPKYITYLNLNRIAVYILAHKLTIEESTHKIGCLFVIERSKVHFVIRHIGLGSTNRDVCSFNYDSFESGRLFRPRNLVRGK